jgi:hypothetical protein
MPLQRNGGPKGSAATDLLFAAKLLRLSRRLVQLFARQTLHFLSGLF